MEKQGREESSSVETTWVTRTPIIKPKRYKPKRDPKPKTMKKPAVDDEETKTSKRKCVQKKKEEQYTPVEESAGGEASTHAKKACRRALDSEDESFKPENREIQHRDETANAKKQDHIAVPNRKHNRSRRMGKEPKNNEAQAGKKRQRKEPASGIYPSGIQYNELFEDNEVRWLYFKDWQKKEMISQAIPNTSFAGGRPNL